MSTKAERDVWLHRTLRARTIWDSFKAIADSRENIATKPASMSIKTSWQHMKWHQFKRHKNVLLCLKWLPNCLTICSRQCSRQVYLLNLKPEPKSYIHIRKGWNIFTMPTRIRQKNTKEIRWSHSSSERKPLYKKTLQQEKLNQTFY